MTKLVETDLIWSYKDPHNGNDINVDFSEYVKDAGYIAIEILSVLKHKLMHTRPYTQVNAFAACRLIFRVVASNALQHKTLNQIADAICSDLQDNTNLSSSSRWSHCNKSFMLLRHVAALRGEEFRRSNIFKKQDVSQKKLLEADQLRLIIRQARKDALRIINEVRFPDPIVTKFVVEANRITNEVWSTLYREQNPEKCALLDRWRSTTDRPLNELIRHLHPSSQDLMPFMILLSFSLAANPDALSMLRRDAIRESTHPIRGPVFIIEMDKPRSGEIPQRYIIDGGPLTEGWLLRAVLEITRPVLKFARPQDQNYVFINVSLVGRVGVVNGSARAEALRQYLKTNNLPMITFKQLRSARLTDEWIRTRDPLRVMRLSGNKKMSLVASYVIREESFDADAVSISDIQKKILKPKKILRSGRGLGRTIMSSHSCTDAVNNDKPKDQHGFCTSLLWPYNDAHYILPLDPIPVSFVLRDYKILCEAEKRMNPARFDKVYREKKKLIEDNILPLISAELYRKAEELVQDYNDDAILIGAL